MTEQNEAPGTVRVAESAQARFGTTRVGVMLAGLRDGEPAARLQIRADDGRSALVVVAPGDVVDLFDAGSVRLVEVEGGRTGTERSWVHLEHLPGGPAAGDLP